MNLMKKISFFIFICLLFAMVVSCESSIDLGVDSVLIKQGDHLDVYDNTSLKLDAVVNGSASDLSVIWTSNSLFAKVSDGFVSFDFVDYPRDVIITATSNQDKSKSDSISITIHHSPIYIKESFGFTSYTRFFSHNEIDVRENFGLFFGESFAKKWYIETTVEINSIIDEGAKIGLMAGSTPVTWNSNTVNMFYYLDLDEMNLFGVCGQNNNYTDWDFENSYSSFNVSETIKENTRFKMGLLRDGANYYMYFAPSVDDEMKCFAHVVYTDLAPCQEAYAWIGGWGADLTVSNFNILMGTAIEEKYVEPIYITAQEDFEITHGERIRLYISSDVINFNRSNLEYISENPDILSINERGVVTVVDVTEIHVIKVTVKYNNFIDEIMVTVVPIE